MKKIVAEFEERTLKVIGLISQYPFVYKSIETDESIRKAFIHKNCSLFYKVKDRKIIVAFFWDNRQEPLL